jgi:hypothetical protein
MVCVEVSGPKPDAEVRNSKIEQRTYGERGTQIEHVIMPRAVSSVPANWMKDSSAQLNSALPLPAQFKTGIHTQKCSAVPEREKGHALFELHSSDPCEQC